VQHEQEEKRKNIDSNRGIRKLATDLNERFGIFRVAKFAIATGIGFLVVEAILALGTLILFSGTKVPSNDYSSPKILGLNALAFGIGVTVSFFLNERFTVRNQGGQRVSDAKSVLVRLLKTQLAFLFGNLVMIGVQLFLLAEFNLTPAIGNIIGAIVSYPVTYFTSMRFVWKLNLIRSEPQDKSSKKEEEEAAKTADSIE